MSGAAFVLPVVITAALVIRSAIGELRKPGSARRQWAFAADRRAVAGGATAAAATVLIGWNQDGPAALAWALIVGALTAQLVHQGTHRP
ncbi:hypothetical protein [Streptomyces sp. DSM 40907]|uniref:hypothetical protein n=1 Tax=Streptomyces kutzneri TaxID=3051179 RepID=UPI0028D73B21|nr:hypothetical protein [Streptomyces sp. DSM 40907]